MLTATQCKMARAALDWGVRELADAAGINVNTVTRFESGKKANVSTQKLIRQACETAGLVFIAGGEASLSGGPGVRLKEASAE
jgi:transcriptional regulator with XRE-family HTH domain